MRGNLTDFLEEVYIELAYEMLPRRIRLGLYQDIAKTITTLFSVRQNPIRSSPDFPGLILVFLRIRHIMSFETRKGHIWSVLNIFIFCDLFCHMISKYRLGVL